MEPTSRKVLIEVAAVLLLASASTLSLAMDAQTDRMESTFVEWVGKHSVENANLVIVRDGAIVGTVGRGRLATSRPVGVASLSKAITGVCIVKLVEAHKLQFDADLGAVLAGRFKRHPPKDQRAQLITIAQLLTHASGITNDPSQGIAFNQFQPFDKPSMDEQFDVALSVPLGNPPGSRYFYNNMNYAALAVVIETVTGEKYGDYCGREVLTKAGVNDDDARSGEWASRGAYGGWKISPEGYAKFLDYFDPSQKLLSISPADWPRFDNRSGRGYSIGTNTRNGVDFFHYGDFTWSNPRANYGAYYAMWHQGVRFVVTYSPNISHELVDELARGVAPGRVSVRVLAAQRTWFCRVLLSQVRFRVLCRRETSCFVRLDSVGRLSLERSTPSRSVGRRSAPLCSCYAALRPYVTRRLGATVLEGGCCRAIVRPRSGQDSLPGHHSFLLKQSFSKIELTRTDYCASRSE